ncbi:Rpn family recombination-promoting nuclease/putative transposase [Thermosyntropha sp.]|uniref:Rpn family recombination-promoting nuclease/putative transposase n=1 Tax=Thermosyntropha sp. TaxID=2740820 RepID=UPI0025F97C9A|nr:Rpn family recombination-promoting nuclease/putative transposase [Thermosyntropha sp.]MBO8159183.1 Rpn family recombination-promoting nuclease/putative transposase [Thermosyntropha sp.]
MEYIKNPHDRYFKENMDNTEIAKSFFEYYLPSELKNIVNLDFLIPQQESFIDEELKESYSDLLFKTKIKGEEGYIYLLVEHKSSPDYFTVLQVLKYLLNIWNREVKKKTKRSFPPIVPLVFYHGQREWKVPRSFSYLIKNIEKYPELKPYIPDFEYLLAEISPDKPIENIEGAVKIFLEFMRIIFHPDKEIFKIELTRNLAELRRLLKKEGVSDHLIDILYRSSVLYIIVVREDIEYEDIKECIDVTIPERSEELMTIAEKLIKEGMEKGIQKGELKAKEETAREAIKAGADLSFTAKITGLSMERIKELEKEVQENG